MPLLRDYIAEHERVTNLGGEAVRALDRSDLDTAARLLREMAAELTAHWKGEEDGLFRVLARDELFAEHIAPLVREHRELDGFLAGVDLREPQGRQAVREAVSDLYEHISKEEDGIFPAALTALTGQDWDAAIEAWRRAHPGRRLLRG